MKRFSIIAACLFALILSTAAFAQNPSGQRNRSGRHQGKKLKKMDTNHDGQITRGEWKGRDRGFQKADQNGDGIITGQEIKSRKRKG